MKLSPARADGITAGVRSAADATRPPGVTGSGGRATTGRDGPPRPLVPERQEYAKAMATADRIASIMCCHSQP
jgi:hypothetical protein